MTTISLKNKHIIALVRREKERGNYTTWTAAAESLIVQSAEKRAIFRKFAPEISLGEPGSEVADG